MNNGMKFKMTFFIVMFLLLVAVIIYIIGGSEVLPEAASQPTQNTPIIQEQADLSGNQMQTQTVPTPVPFQQTQMTVQQTVPQTVPQTADPIYLPPEQPQTLQTSAPIITPEPTPEPTPVPQPVGMAAGSGTVRSNSGTLLNTHCDWSAAVADEKNVTVTLILYVDHYQLDYSAYQAVNFRLGEASQTIDGADIHDTESGLKSTQVGTVAFTVPAARGDTVSLPLSASWSFGGQYGDGNGNKVDIGKIICEGTVTISR